MEKMCTFAVGNRGIGDSGHQAESKSVVPPFQVRSKSVVSPFPIFGEKCILWELQTDFVA